MFGRAPLCRVAASRGLAGSALHDELPPAVRLSFKPLLLFREGFRPIFRPPSSKPGRPSSGRLTTVVHQFGLTPNCLHQAIFGRGHIEHIGNWDRQNRGARVDLQRTMRTCSFDVPGYVWIARKFMTHSSVRSVLPRCSPISRGGFPSPNAVPCRVQFNRCLQPPLECPSL
jgi:hypothetical protein